MRSHERRYAPIQGMLTEIIFEGSRQD